MLVEEEEEGGFLEADSCFAYGVRVLCLLTNATLIGARSVKTSPLFLLT